MAPVSQECDVLSLLWGTQGRDIEISRPIVFDLRERGYHVVEDCVFNYRSALLRHRPRLLIVASTFGDGMNKRAVQYARALGIEAMSIQSEATYAANSSDEALLGWHYGKTIDDSVYLNWSSMSCNIYLERWPELRSKFLVTGGTGFDRYRILPRIKKLDFLKKSSRTEEKIVGFAGWTFDVTHSMHPQATAFLKNFGADQVRRFAEDRIGVNRVLRALIQANSDTLFILKLHPATVIKEHTEFEGLLSFPNVLRVESEYSITECIQVSDLWLSYESTTNLEAWLLDKPTFLINPSGTDFRRASFYQGTVNLETPEVAQEVLEAYFNKSTESIVGQTKMDEFHSLSSVRSRLISDYIGWGDGKNHMRAGYLIDQVIRAKQLAHLASPGFAHGLRAWLQATLYYCSWYFNFRPFAYYRRARLEYRKHELAVDNQKIYPWLKIFREDHPLTAGEIDEVRRLNANLFNAGVADQKGPAGAGSKY